MCARRGLSSTSTAAVAATFQRSPKKAQPVPPDGTIGPPQLRHLGPPLDGLRMPPTLAAQQITLTYCCPATTARFRPIHSRPALGSLSFPHPTHCGACHALTVSCQTFCEAPEYHALDRRATTTHPRATSRKMPTSSPYITRPGGPWSSTASPTGPSALATGPRSNLPWRPLLARPLRQQHPTQARPTPPPQPTPRPWEPPPPTQRQRPGERLHLSI